MEKMEIVGWLFQSPLGFKKIQFDPPILRDPEAHNWSPVYRKIEEVEPIDPEAIFGKPIKRISAQPAVQQEPVAWMVKNGLVDYQLMRSKSQADALAIELQKRHDLSGSLSSFWVQPLYPHQAPAEPAAEAQPVGLYTHPAREVKARITDDHGKPLHDQRRIIKQDGKWRLLFDVQVLGDKAVSEFCIQKIEHDVFLYPGISLEEAIKRFDEKVRADNE